MHNPYDVHSWSKLYREEARQRRLERSGDGRGSRSGRSRVGVAWTSLLSLLSGAGLLR